MSEEPPTGRQASSGVKDHRGPAAGADEALLRSVLRLVAGAEPAELAAMKRFLTRGSLPDAERRPERRQFSLRHWPGLWEVWFDGEQGFFEETAGMPFIEHHLEHPGEAIHPVVLLARLQGEQPLEQRFASQDDQEAREEYEAQMDRLWSMIQDTRSSPAARKIAEEHLKQLESAQNHIHQHTHDQAARVVKSVRQAMTRSIAALADARDKHRQPYEVLAKFVAHLREYLPIPPRPGSAPAGSLIYLPPPGVIWTR